MAKYTDATMMTVEEIEVLAVSTLQACGVSEFNSKAVARSVAFAERDGQTIVGLSYLPTYCDHALCGKVDGNARPELTLVGSGSVRVDAKMGFAHPAIDIGLPTLALNARAHGLAALSISNSYACGSLGYFVETLADQRLLALMVANASPSIAAHGGKRPFFGTNPIALAVPRRETPPLLLDQSSSVVARVAVNEALRQGVPIPIGWALDSEGNPTTDPTAADRGSLLPIGGYKGAGLALLVDILAGGLTGSNFSFEASSFGDCEGGPPRTGQFLIAIDPAFIGGQAFVDRIETLLVAMADEPGVRLPGERRLSARARHVSGIPVPNDVLALVRQQQKRQADPDRINEGAVL